MIYQNFNHDEFDNELKNLDWENTFRNNNCGDNFTTFFKTIERLLDEMAPVRRLNNK